MFCVRKDARSNIRKESDHMIEEKQKKEPKKETEVIKETKQTKKKRNWRAELTEDLILILVVFAVVAFLQQYVLVNAKIPSGSMENTIMTGDRVLGSRLVYRKNDPERGDIVIFRYPDRSEEHTSELQSR